MRSLVQYITEAKSKEEIKDKIVNLCEPIVNDKDISSWKVLKILGKVMISGLWKLNIDDATDILKKLGYSDADINKAKSTLPSQRELQEASIDKNEIKQNIEKYCNSLKDEKVTAEKLIEVILTLDKLGIGELNETDAHDIIKKLGLE